MLGIAVDSCVVSRPQPWPPEAAALLQSQHSSDRFD
jgi:hypothetical protein